MRPGALRWTPLWILYAASCLQSLACVCCRLHCFLHPERPLPTPPPPTPPSQGRPPLPCISEWHRQLSLGRSSGNPCLGRQRVPLLACLAILYIAKQQALLYSMRMSAAWWVPEYLMCHVNAQSRHVLSPPASSNPLLALQWTALASACACTCDPSMPSCCLLAILANWFTVFLYSCRCEDGKSKWPAGGTMGSQGQACLRHWPDFPLWRMPRTGGRSRASKCWSPSYSVWPAKQHLPWALKASPCLPRFADCPQAACWLISQPMPHLADLHAFTWQWLIIEGMGLICPWLQFIEASLCLPRSADCSRPQDVPQSQCLTWLNHMHSRGSSSLLKASGRCAQRLRFKTSRKHVSTR